MPATVGGSWFSFLFWRLWKWCLRFFTRRCELQRICQRENTLPERSRQIALSLRNSKNKDLQVLASDGSGQYQPEDAVKIILKAKGIVKEKDPSFVVRLEASMCQIISLNYTKNEIWSMVQEKYSQDNTEHEQALMKLWGLLMPHTQLKSRITNQWGEIGFQGNNPATDFRGMGILGLQCLVYFAECYTNKARKVLSNSQHPSNGYPFAISGINLTSLMVSWLKDGTFDFYFFHITEERDGITKIDFYDAYSYIVYAFNQYWFEADPENVMEYPRIKDQFAMALKRRLCERPITIKLLLE